MVDIKVYNHKNDYYQFFPIKHNRNVSMLRFLYAHKTYGSIASSCANPEGGRGSGPPENHKTNSSFERIDRNIVMISSGFDDNCNWLLLVREVFLVCILFTQNVISCLYMINHQNRWHAEGPW